jgi:DNA-directed RNA polymerase specialized sigma subunit
MSKLEELISEREKIRAKEKHLTGMIQQERNRIAEDNRKNCEPKFTGVSVEVHNELLKEKTRLAGLLGIFARANGKTFKEIGEMLNVTPSRAQQLVNKEKKNLLAIDASDDDSA